MRPSPDPTCRHPRPAAGPALALAALLATSALAPAPASAQRLDPDESLFWAASGVALVVAVGLDDRLRPDTPPARGPVSSRLAVLGYGLGGSGILVPTLATLLTTAHLVDWPADSERMLNVAVGIGAASAVTELVKTTVGRGRPRSVGHPYRFQPLTRHNAWLAFPSGHATAGFAAAAALSAEFDLGAFEPVAWGLAGLVAWSRVYDDAHWTSDTVAGAIVGIAVARATIAHLHARRAEADADGAVAGDPLLAADRRGGPGIPIVLARIPVR